MSGQICYSKDGEMFNYDCVEDLDLEVGETYYFGESQEIVPSAVIPKFQVDEILEHIEERLFNEVGELAYDCISVNYGAKSELLEFIKKWADENIKINCYKVINVKSSVFNGDTDV